MILDDTLHVLEAIGKGPATASDIDAHPHSLLSLAGRGLLLADRKKYHPNIYSLTPKGEALIELLKAPITLTPADGAVKRIQMTVAAHFGKHPMEMTSERRSNDVAWPRQVAMYLARETTPLSLPNIGRRFGGRDHTTVIHAIKKVKERAANDEEFAAELEILRERLAG